MAVVDVDHHAIRIEHLADRARDGETVHPVEGRGERHDAKQTEVRGQALRAHVDPLGVREPSFGREAASFLDHVGVGVDADDGFEQVGDPEGNRARPAADVEQTTRAGQSQRVLERIGEVRRVREPATRVVGGSTPEQGVVPLPLLPAARHWLDRSDGH